MVPFNEMNTIHAKYGQNIARQNIERQSEPNLSRNIASRNGPREAKEVFLFMQRTVRISRNVRARWFLEHLNKPIRATNIDDSSFLNDAGDKTDDYEGLTVVGVLAKDDFASRPDEEFLVVSSTIITYFSKLYRLIFIFDFSPSSFVSDESDESVLYTKLIQSVTKCVRNLTKEFKFPGGASNFKPQLLVTFCAFTPFLCFPEDSVLLQGVLLTEENVEEVLNFIHNRVKEYLNKLCSFTQPHMKEWNNRRRRYRRVNDDVLGNLIQSNSFPDGISIQPKLSNASSLLITPASTTDRGFIQPDWALIFMLRMGLMAVQMLPENTQSNIVIVTDGVCGIPDNTALQNALSQLRAFTISCSFIQLRQSSMRGPVLGHVGFPELFRFLATATFGSFLSEDELTDETKSIEKYNMYHKSFLAWSFHRGLLRESGSLPDLIPATLRTLHFRNKELSRTYETSLSKLLYVRLREGYTIKHVEIQKRLDLAEMIVVKLSLAWKPNIFLEYSITSPWNQLDQHKRCKIHVDVYLDAVGNSAMDSCGDRQDPDSVKIMIRNLHNADGLLIHLHIFNTDSHYYTLSKEFDQAVPLFEYKKGSQKPVLSEKYENLKSTKFVQFWHPLCLLDEGIWQKWVHTHSLRLCLAHDLPLPEKIFTPASNKGRFSQLTAEVAFHALHDLLRANATFTLVKDQIYIKMIYENDESVPSYFYLIRSSLEMPFVILKVAFLGGVSGVTRKKVLDNLKELLKDLKIKREIQYITSVAPSITKCFHSNLLLLLRKPMERILVKYRSIPRCLDQIIRLEKSDNLRDNREMILHNAVAKYLTCKRQVWFLREVFLKNPVPSSFTSIRNHFPNSSEATCIEFILQTLLRRRLNQDFSIAYGRNGILNLVRQHEDQTYPFLPKVEQCVIFGPSFADNNTVELNSPLIRREPQQNGGDKTGTMSTLDSSIFQNSLQIWPQLVTEVWTEAQDSTHLEWLDQNKVQLLEENNLVIQTLFTFEQWMKACNSKLWIEKPFVLSDRSQAAGAEKLSTTVDCWQDTFNFKALLRHATEKELILLPALGYSHCDPHSNTRLSILLRSLQQELSECCDTCVEVTDTGFLLDIIALLESQLEVETDNKRSNDVKIALESHEISPSEEQPSFSREKRSEEEEDTATAEPNVSSLSSSSTPAALIYKSQPIRPSPKLHPAAMHVASSPPSPSLNIPSSATFTPIQARCSSSSPSSESSSLMDFPSASPTARSPKFSASANLPHRKYFSGHEGGDFAAEDALEGHAIPGHKGVCQAFQEIHGEKRSTSVPLLSEEKGCPPQKSPQIENSGFSSGRRMTSPQKTDNEPCKTKPALKKLKLPVGQLSASDFNVATAQSCEQISGANGTLCDVSAENMKKYSSTAFSNDELCSPTKMMPMMPAKKFSAPPSSLCPDSTKTEQANAYSTNQKLAGIGVRIYAKRLSDHQIVMFVVPKDARSINAFVPPAHLNMFPVLAYHCDRALMAQWLAESDDILQKDAVIGEDIIVENFCRKAETSTLAHLSRQVSRRTDHESFDDSPTSLESFYVLGPSSNFDQVKSEQSDEVVHTKFDLAKYCERFFEEYIFTRSYVATIYVCLGQEIFVPSSVLFEAVDYRCDYTNIEIGSINEILNDTCNHMKRKLKNEARWVVERRRHKRLFSTSSDESSSGSTVEESTHGLQKDSDDFTLPLKEVLPDSGVMKFKDDIEGGLGSTGDSNETASTISEGACEDEFNDFRCSFEDLLRQHSFIKVPGLTDYFFYWPHSTCATTQMPSFDELIEDLPKVLSPCLGNNNTSFTENQKTNFSRSNSTRNAISTSRQTEGRGTRKPSASASINKRRSTNQSESLSNINDEESGSVLSRRSSCESFEVESADDEPSDSEKSSLAEELLGADNWPLFIQFSVAVHINGQMDTFPVEFIPNCLKDILRRCGSNILPPDDLLNIGVNIDMYVLTWPLPSQSPYREEPIQWNEENHSDGDSVDNRAHNFSGQHKRAPQTAGRYSILRTGMDREEVYERKTEMLREIPVQEHRTLRKLQRNIQRMLKVEHILIMTRDFGKHQNEGARRQNQEYKSLKRVIRIITDEVSQSAKNSNQQSNRRGEYDRRFQAMTKELILVQDPEEGLRRVCARLSDLKVEYCSLKKFQIPSRMSSKEDSSPLSTRKESRTSAFDSKSENDPMIFYTCGVGNLDMFSNLRHESLISSQAPHMAQCYASKNMDFEVKRKDVKSHSSRQSSTATFQGESAFTSSNLEKLSGNISEREGAGKKHSFERVSEDDSDAFEKDDESNEESTAVDEETVSDITMPLNDQQFDKNINDKYKLAFTSRSGGNSLECPFGAHKNQLLHDFWLIVLIEQDAESSQNFLKIYFCQRSPLVHNKLFSTVCKMVEEQIKIVNQELLLEKMHRTEEADQLLIDINDNLCMHSLDACRSSKSSRDIAGEANIEHLPLSKHVSKFAHRPTSISLDVRNKRASAPCSDDEDRNADGSDDVGEIVRYKFSPGYFACDMVWHYWFPVHPRLQSSRPFGGSSDIGFKALRMGLEGLAVRNRSNMYVYREGNGNIVYMRLHSSEESIYANISNKSDEWQEEVSRNINSCILLSVHGIKPPGEEITELLNNVLHRRLNHITLQEIQNALLKNAHIRLEWTDIKFIQQDPQNPCEVYYFTVPAMAQGYLGSLQYYLGQQLLTFCIRPKFREQSGIHQHHHQLAMSLNSNDGTFSSSYTNDSFQSGKTGDAVPPTPLHFASTFVPYTPANAPSNPSTYIPAFYLVNKLPGEGKRDTGIACLEAKLIDWQGRLVEKLPEGLANHVSHNSLYPGLPNANDRLQIAARLHELSKCVQVQNLFDGNPVPGTCALLQFNMWKNGNVGADELASKLKMCVQQAIFDLVTEFGLLSMPIFESNGSRSIAGSFSISESRAVHHQHLQRQNAQDSTRSDSSSKRSFADALSPITNPSLSFASTLQSSSAQKSRGPYSSNEPTSPPYNISSAQGRDPLAQSISSVPLSSPSLEPNPQYGALGSIHPHSSSNLSQKANSPLPGIQGSDQYSEASMASNAGRNYDPTRASMRTQQRHRQRLAELRSPDPMTSSMLSSTSTLHSEDNSMTVIPITGRESGQAETQTQGMHRQPVTLPLLGRQYDETRSHPQAPPYPIYQHNLGKISPTTSTPPATSSSLPPQIATGAPGLNSTIARPQPMGSAVSQISSVGTSRGESKEESSASGIVEYLRNDFVAAADEWFNYVTNEAKGFPDSTVHHSIRKFQFSLDCDGSARKIVQVIYSRLKDLLKGEKVVICRGSPTTESNTKRRLQTLLSITSLTDPIDKDFGRIVNISKEDDTELVLVAYNEQQTLDTLRRGQEPSVPMPTSLIKLADSEQDTYSKFLPNLKPFIPRQRLIYLIMRGEGSTCYLYNYTNDVVSKTKEIVERAILWHNARSRLLREIGLHKMGITHLSTLKSADAKFNSYLLLTWMDPETLVRNDYPVDNLETPDFSKIPRLYAQMLLKLYRFSDPAFVAKNLNPSPFEDQTQQMLTLREDVRAMLNDHREFQEIHKKLISGDSTFAEDIFNRILRRSHQDHFVQSPILLFPNWRRKVGAIRTGADWSLVGCRKHSYPSLNVHSTVRSSPKIRSKTITSSCPEKPGKVENEPCLLRIQQLLIEDYVKHLKCIKFEDSLSLNVIKLEQIPEPVHSKTSSGGNGAVSCTSPNVWLYLALPGGIIFMELCFVDPYFCVRILQWNNSLLEECLYPNSKPSFEQRDRLRHLDRVKNELMQKSHVHSFTYDFHLRIVAKYLTGGTQVLFNPGYNTNAFLTDFLQYYGCRPSFARNCIYEENIQCTHLQVSHSNIWEFFLDNEQQFGWNVVRLKTLDQSNSADEFMLVSKEEQKMLQNQFYTFVTMILNNAKSSTLKDHQISIKFYVILIAEEEVSPTITDASPLEAVDSTDAGEFRRVAGAPNISPQSTMLGGAGGDLLTPFEESDTGEIEDDESTPVAHAGIPNADDIVNRNYGISVPYRTNFYPERERAEPNTITDILGIDSNRRRFCSGGNVNTGRHTSAPTRNFGSNGRDGRRSSETPLPSLGTAASSPSGLQKLSLSQCECPASPQSGKRGTICHEHECDENSPSSEHKRLSILRAPPRRHRHPGSIDQNANDMGVLVPPEQVTYLHYLSSHQRRLQQLLEESVKIKNGEITRFVLDADKLTYRNKLWKSLLSSKSSHIRRQQTLSFIPPSTSKMDVLADSSQKLMSSSEMEPDDFDSLLRIIRMERMVDEEPRIAQILAGVNFQDLTRFLIQYYEGEKRCRYFENGPRAYLIIMNPSFLDSATMFSNCPKNGIEMFFLFKNTDRSFGKVEQEPFSANSIHKMFEDVVSCLCAFTWSNMLHNPPTLP